MSKSVNTVKVSIKGFNPRQKEITLDIINTPSSIVKFFVVRASRKSGKSWMLLRLMLYFSLVKDNMTIAFASASWDFTKKFYDEFMKITDKSLISHTNKNESVYFKNGSVIYFYSAGSSILPVGLTVDYLFCDEFALYRKEVWDYLRPIVIAKKEAKVIVASTPRGHNSFYQMCQLGIENKGRHRHYRMHYTDNPKIDLQQIEDDRLSMPKMLFDQEYEAEFTDGQSGVFGDFRKILTINAWTNPIINNVYFYGLDVAGVGDDKTILTILDQQGKVNLIYECESGDMVIQGDELEPLIRKYNAIGYCEKNGIGQGLADILRAKKLNVKYFNTSNESKQKIVTALITNINKNEIQLPTAILCPQLENEMSTFSSKRTSTGLISYAAEKGLHDDYVFSLMFANYARLRLGSGLQVFNPEEEDEFAEALTPVEMPRTLTMMEMKAAMSTWSDNLKY